MKIIAISDIHENYKINIEEYDVFIFAGDICNFGKNIISYVKFNNWLKTIPCKYKIVIAGNHDFLFEIEPTLIKNIVNNCIYLHNEFIIIDGIKFYGSPYCPEFGNWAFNRSRENLKKIWSLIPNDTDVLITHTPPFNICDFNGEENVGCKILRERVLGISPVLHLFGHIHECYGRGHRYKNTLFFNVCYNEKFNNGYVFEI